MTGTPEAAGEDATDGVARAKAELRRHALAARRAAAPEALAAADAARDRHLRSLVAAALEQGEVAAYASLGTEPSTRALLRPGVLLPVLLPDGDLDWARYDGRLGPGPRGLLEPVGPRLGADAVAGCALVLVPAVLVARDGTRLGRGGGSYDRALRRAGGRRVALLHDGELVDALPAEPHDVAVDAVALPGGLVGVGSAFGGIAP